MLQKSADARAVHVYTTAVEFPARRKHFMCIVRMKNWLLVVPAVIAFSGFCADDKPYMTFNNPPKTPQALLEHKTFPSAAMKQDVGYNIYLPPGYAENATQRYPVVYWFHGMNNSESSDQFPAKYLDDGIKDKSLPPMIIVYACGGQKSFYSDSIDGKFMAETGIIKELIPHIDATYRTIATREGRAVQGMSMGGFGCLKLAFKYPELFSSAVAFAGGYVDAPFLNKKSPELIEKLFGDAAKFDENHPFNWAKKNAEQFRGKLAIKMYIGNKDFLYDCNKQMHAILDELKVPHEYIEVDGVEHNLGKLSQFAKKDGFKFAAEHFGEKK
jgi:enterochelin esterase-like enzyme